MKIFLLVFAVFAVTISCGSDDATPLTENEQMNLLGSWRQLAIQFEEEGDIWRDVSQCTGDWQYTMLYTYNANGTYRVVNLCDEVPQPLSGTYTVDGDVLTLNLLGEVQTYRVIVVNTTTIILHMFEVHEGFRVYGTRFKMQKQ